ncbi:MAG TPA: M42 family peptidase [Candidatus Limiplasma sp.]|nr:M42 family peptidase [Candidatus Limiplasma sp.]HPS80796.1 M42 family peptidase [Candidatus Limiplasma sp.]
MDLKTLCEAQGLSGREEKIRRMALDACVKAFGQSAVTLDGLGSVIARRKGANSAKPTVMLAAHMDEVGLMVISATEEGLLRFRAIGGVDARVLVSKRVRVGYEAEGKPSLPGVIGALAIHLQTAEDRKTVLPIEQLYIDIGAKDKAEAERLAPAGTLVTFDTPYTPFGDGCVLAKAFDDRVGVYNLLRLLDAPYDGDLVFAFTSQEEAGCRGAVSAGYSVQPDIALILECTSANDLGETPEALQVCRVGQGVCVSFMDNASIGDAELYRALLATGEAQGIPHQIKQFVSGGNDAGSIQRSGAGSRTLALSVPCRNIHSPACVCSVRDIDSQEALTRAYLQSL